MNQPEIVVIYEKENIPSHLITLNHWGLEIKVSLLSINNWVKRYPNFPKATAIVVGIGNGALLFDRDSLTTWRNERTMKTIKNCERRLAVETKRLERYRSALQTNNNKGEIQ